MPQDVSVRTGPITASGFPCAVGDMVTCYDPASWTHGRTFCVVELDVQGGGHHRCKNDICTSPQDVPEYAMLEPRTLLILSAAGACAGAALRAFSLGKMVCEKDLRLVNVATGEVVLGGVR